MAYDGGAIYLENEVDKDINIKHNIFSNNQAQRRGGAIYINSKAVLTNNTFTLNTASLQGSSVYLS